MTKFRYKTHRFSNSCKKIIEIANKIIDEYMADGYDLTLRQLYYQFVARGYIPNKESEYKKLGNIISDGRLAGLIDWDAITDRLRIIEENSHWNHSAEIVQACSEQFKLDSRKDQDTYIEVWVEKDALSGVLERVCPSLDVPYLSCRGYVSQSALWRASLRFLKEENNREGLLIYLGDHDPSGVDMFRDIRDRLEIFGCKRTTFERIALTMEQIKEYNPPPNPAKITDSRYDAYVQKYSDESWELDALDPRVIVEMIDDFVSKNTDVQKINKILKKQRFYKKQLKNIADKLEAK